MKKLTVLMMLLPVVAMANNQPPVTPNLASAESHSEAASNASARSTAAAQQGQLQEQTATGGNGFGGNSTATATNAASNEGNSLTNVSNVRRAAASANAPAVYASNVCAVGWSIGGQLPGVGASGGKSKVDRDCNLRENIRIVSALNPALALKAACQLEGIREVATGDDCVYTFPEPVQETAKSEHVTIDLSGYATKQEVAEAFKRSVSK